MKGERLEVIDLPLMIYIGIISNKADKTRMRMK